MIGGLLGATHFLRVAGPSGSAGFGIDNQALGYQQPATGAHRPRKGARENPVAATTMEA
jgi:hypothetical protein